MEEIVYLDIIDGTRNEWIRAIVVIYQHLSPEIRRKLA